MGIGDDRNTRSDGGGTGPALPGYGALGRRRVLAAGLGAVAGLGAIGTIGTGRRASAAERTADVPATGGPRPRPAATRRMYVGAYTSSGGGKGVGLAQYDPQSGALSMGGTLTGVADPSFLALSASGANLYTVDEQAQGSVTAVAVAADGTLRVMGAQSTGGSGPCHLSVHAGGRHVLSANYDSGSIAVHPLADDGGLLPRSDLVRHTGSGPDPDRQDGPHAHMVRSDPGGGFVLAVDLGTDTVYTYRLDASAGTLASVSQAKVTPGSGPRHLAFHPSSGYAYLANELGDSVIVCGYDPSTGAVSPGQPQPTVPTGSPSSGRNYPAEALVSADGAFAYVSNRGHDSVARFAVEDDGASLRLLDATATGGVYPRHIAFDPTGTLLFAANQNSGTITAFHVNQSTGALASAGPALSTPTPVCVLPV
jgi:6-phosphogluconolactonase